MSAPFTRLAHSSEAARPIMPLVDQLGSDLCFARLFDGASAEGSCIVSGGVGNACGYTSRTIANVKVVSHRLSWVLFHGREVPVGMFVCHRCDNPPCINPAHLWLGTGADNVADKMLKGRHRSGDMRGSRHPAAKITEDVARSIFGDACDAVTAAVRYGASVDTVHRIRRRVAWAEATKGMPLVLYARPIHHKLRGALR